MLYAIMAIIGIFFMIAIPATAQLWIMLKMIQRKARKEEEDDKVEEREEESVKSC